MRLLELNYMTGYVMTQQVAAVWVSGWCECVCVCVCERAGECVLSVGYLRNRERGVVCDRVGMDQ